MASCMRPLVVLFAMVAAPACRKVEQQHPQSSAPVAGTHLGAVALTGSASAMAPISSSLSTALKAVAFERCDQLPPSEEKVPRGPDELDVRQSAVDSASRSRPLLRVFAT